MRFVATHKAPDSVLEKYRDKLVRKAKEYSTEYRLKEAKLMMHAGRVSRMLRN